MYLLLTYGFTNENVYETEILSLDAAPFSCQVERERVRV